MPDHDTNRPTEKHETVRRAFRLSVAHLVADRRIEPIDAALGAVYAAHDLAMHAGMNRAEAVEWMRSAVDLMEGQLLAAVRSAH